MVSKRSSEVEKVLTVFFAAAWSCPETKGIKIGNPITREEIYILTLV